MTVRSCLLAGWLGLSAQVGFGLAQDAVPSLLPAATPRKIQLDTVEPALSPVDVANQKTAEAIATALGQNAKLAGYRIDVSVVEGVAELHGKVTDANQLTLAKQIARSVPGVTEVRTQLTLASSEIAAVQDQVPVVPKSGPPMIGPSLGGPGGAPGGAFPPQPSQVTPPPFTTVPNSPFPAPAAMMMNHPGMMPNPQYQPPPMPPYAWPTYAPYNNYSRVAHPTLHTYNQWPFIGPMYPYPKIPLGWRRVTLEWQDGSWWYGRESNSHDWWRVRYW